MDLFFVEIKNPNPDELITSITISPLDQAMYLVKSCGTQNCSTSALAERLKAIFGEENVFSDDQTMQEDSVDANQFTGEKIILFEFDNDVNPDVFAQKLYDDSLIDEAYLNRIKFEIKKPPQSEK